MRLWILRIGVLLNLLFLCACDSSVTQKGEFIDFIPPNTSVVYKIDDLVQFQNDLKDNLAMASFSSESAQEFLTKQNKIVKNLGASGEVVLCVSKDSAVQQFTVLASYSKQFSPLDSLNTADSKKTPYNKNLIHRIVVENDTTYTAIKDSIYMASSSETIIKDILDKKSLSNPSFRKVFSMNMEDGISILKQGNNLQVGNSSISNFASWSRLETKISASEFSATGVAIAEDSTTNLLNIFKGLTPQQNQIAKITPSSARSVCAITYNDVSILLANLSAHTNTNRTTNVLTPILETANEVGQIELTNGSFVILNSIDTDQTQEAIAPFMTQETEFRNVAIFQFSESDAFKENLHPFVTIENLSFAFQLDSFFVFTTTLSTAEVVISDYTNNNCLVNTPSFEATKSELSDASSLLFFNLQGDVAQTVSSLFSTELSNATSASLKKYPLIGLQYIYDRDFAHVNVIGKETTQAKQTNGTVTQLFSSTLDADILGNPTFFSNHRTRGKDVVVQDVENKLYLFSASGKLLWKKEMDGPILGKINEVDLLRNGKKQLTFVTQKALHVIDRNGKNVAPFPKQFKDPITQPLSLFDYDNNRRYRFVITQGQEVHMYDSQGKTVNGFTFKKAASRIILPPQHLRINRKDYLLFAEESGKLNILSRTGKERVKVTEKFNFSEIPIAREGNDFVVITKENSKARITAKGNVSKKALEVGGGYWLTTKGTTKATLDENLLRINGKLVELPFGIYTTPSIYIANRKTYITVTETQENKVYMYTKGGELVAGFPVFGSSSVEVINNRRENHVLTTGNKNEILLYQSN